MKKTLLLIASLFFAFGFASAQDVFFAGNHLNTGKIWKNDSLIYSFPDSLNIQLRDLKTDNSGNLYTAGYSYDTATMWGHIWRNDSCLFSADTNTYIEKMLLNGEVWTAAGGNKVWQNGMLLYTYEIDSATICILNALAIDTLTGDIYAGGATTDSLARAMIWKNDTILWIEDSLSSVEGLCFDGQDLYAAGFMRIDSTFDGIIWKNDSIILQVENASFSHIVAYDSSLYWIGYVADTFYVFQDGAPIYSLPEANGITALVVNEFGVYCAVAIDGVPAIWKDGEILYQPANCQNIAAVAVLPTPPLPEFTLTVMANDTLWGSVSGGGIYTLGDTATIAAFPNIGCEFLYWNDSITDNPRDVIVLSDSTFTAHFGLIEYLIETSVMPEEGGTVTEGGIHHYGDTLTLEAVPNLGYVFDGWNDSITDNPRDIIVVSDSSFVAHFSLMQCSVTTEVTPEGAGTVEGGGVFDYGTITYLTAQNNEGYAFSQWADGVADNPREILVVGDTIFVAQFTPLQYEITTAVNPEHGGTVEGGGIYDYGTTAILTAIPNEYFMFLCWSDGNVSNPRNVTVTQDATYTALFRQNGTPEYTVTVLANDPTLGTVEGNGTYPEDSTIEISATPYANAFFVSWDDGNTDNPRSVTVTQDLTFTALFEMTPMYTIRVEANDTVMGSVYGGGTYFANTIINIGATPNEGYYFAGWQDGDTNNPRLVTVTEDAVYTAQFTVESVLTYTVTVYCDENQGFVIGAGTYQEGSVARLAAIPADGYLFVKWSDNTTDNPKEIIVDRDIVMAAFFDGTGVDEDELSTLYLYPNPADDKIHLEGLEKEAEVRIYNDFGILVKTQMLSGDGEIALGDLPSGLYLVRIGRQCLKVVKR